MKNYASVIPEKVYHILRHDEVIKFIPCYGYCIALFTQRLSRETNYESVREVLWIPENFHGLSKFEFGKSYLITCTSNHVILAATPA